MGLSNFFSLCSVCAVQMGNNEGLECLLSYVSKNGILIFLLLFCLLIELEKKGSVLLVQTQTWTKGFS